MNPLPRRFTVIAIAAAALLNSTPSSDAATAAGAGIEVNGKYIGGYTITLNGETREELVEQLSKRWITFERDYKIPVAADDPNRATLEGQIRLLSKIRGDRQVGATTKVLKLVKRGGKWFVDAESLNRALKNPPVGAFVQDGIRIALPVRHARGKDGKPIIKAWPDGGTTMVRITDAAGKEWDVYFDRRLTPSPPPRPGEEVVKTVSNPETIYLNAYPGKTGSILVIDQKRFRESVMRGIDH